MILTNLLEYFISVILTLNFILLYCRPSTSSPPTKTSSKSSSPASKLSDRDQSTLKSTIEYDKEKHKKVIDFLTLLVMCYSLVQRCYSLV